MYIYKPYTGWGIKIAHILKRYRKWKKLSRKKNLIYFWKVRKKQFFKWVLKIISDIWRPSLATHCWRRSPLSGLAQAEWSRFPVGSFPSHPQEIEDYVWKPFPLGIPKGKSHMGVSTEREACAEPSLSRYHRTVVLIICFNNKAPMFTGPIHCRYWKR